MDLKNREKAARLQFWMIIIITEIVVMAFGLAILITVKASFQISEGHQIELLNRVKDLGRDRYYSTQAKADLAKRDQAIADLKKEVDVLKH